MGDHGVQSNNFTHVTTGDHSLVVSGDVYVQGPYVGASDFDRAIGDESTGVPLAAAMVQSPTDISSSQPPEMIVQGGNGARVNGRQVFRLNLWTGSGLDIAISPLSQIEHRKDMVTEAVGALSPADMTLLFVSNLWGFTLDLPLPSRITVDSLTRILLDGLDLPRMIDIPNVRSDVEVRWNLQCESGAVLSPRDSLADAGLKSGDAVYLRAEILPVEFMYG